MPRVNKTYETIIKDFENNEIKETITDKVIVWKSEPSYIKLYLQDILYLSDMPKGYEKILFELLKHTCYADEKEGMRINLSSGIKKQIAKKLDIKNVRSINNALSDLVKGKVLYRIDTGLYQLNPYLFGKGNWNDISKLRTEIDYDEIKGRTFKTVIEYKN